MDKLYFQFIYLISCAVNKISPSKEFLDDIDQERLFKLSSAHSLDAIVGTTLKASGVKISTKWEENIQKSIRKAILFDAERKKICVFFESNQIWYMPLKGVILKDFYPSLGLRQMSDNDILFDKTRAKDVKTFMLSQGYRCLYYGIGQHDSYEKEPVYNFELHTSLYSLNKKFEKYYKNVNNRLVKNSESDYKYGFTDEDFYIYILTHAYKHYTSGGTGVRSLLDFYVYLINKPNLDFSYIENECKKLDIFDYEIKSRNLCMKIFKENIPEKSTEFEEYLTNEEMNELMYYISSGAYGRQDRQVKNKLERFKKEKNGNKFKFIIRRIFPDMEVYKIYYPFFYKHKILLPIGWFYRLIKGVTLYGKRNFRELKILLKLK